MSLLLVAGPFAPSSKRNLIEMASNLITLVSICFCLNDLQHVLTVFFEEQLEMRSLISAVQQVQLDDLGGDAKA